MRPVFFCCSFAGWRCIEFFSVHFSGDRLSNLVGKCSLAYREAECSVYCGCIGSRFYMVTDNSADFCRCLNSLPNFVS